MAKILIDMQACQTESRQRGIGRYAMALVQAMAAQASEDEIHLLLNSAFPETILPLRQIFSSQVSPQHIHIMDVLTPNEDRVAANRWRNNASALLREAFIEMLAPDIVFCPSFFEGYIDDAVLSINRLSTIPVVATLHDLIPLIYKDDYLDPNPDFSRHYLDKIEEFKQCAGILTISDASAAEGHSHLGLEPQHIVNASEAGDTTFHVLDLNEQDKQRLRRKFGIAKPFIFYTGGSDPRKNLPRLVEAFSGLPDAVRKSHQLVFAGNMPEFERLALQKIARTHGLGSDELIFLGYVSDDDLVELYNLAQVFAFPSLHEGFGLPCLEAFQCGLPVIGANTSSLPEVIGNPDALFDPWSVQDIRGKLASVLTDEEFRSGLIQQGADQAKRFSWEESAGRALAALRGWARPSQSEPSWQDRRQRNDELEERLIAAIADLAATFGDPSERDLLSAAKVMAQHRTAAEAVHRATTLTKPLQWRIEGPFDSTYSLALVNRELSRALEADGQTVSLWSSEGPGDFEPQADFLSRNPDLDRIYQRAVTQQPDQADIVTRNMYPPRVIDMTGRINGLHNYAWEETGFPFEYVKAFNESLQFITVTSEHVKRVLIDNGVSVPVTVVGNGVDHWTRVKPSSAPAIPSAGYRFLHVSSCFPRKGADALIESYGQAFSDADDVLLIIKTFRNPHNTIEAQLEALRRQNPHYPNVHLLWDDMSDEQLKALYQQCDALVAPSRAEGFGLPIAEAMLSGMHVIATGWSGQMDFCSADNADLIDFSFATAATHEQGKFDSVWAEPDKDHLTQLLRKAYEKGPLPAVDRDISDAVLQQYSWAQVARRNVEAALQSSSQTVLPEPRIGWVSTFNKRCGIATYSKHLIDVLEMPVVVLAGHADERTAVDDANVKRCWGEGKHDDLENLLAQVDDLNLDLIVVQFNYGFFDLEALAIFLHKLIDQGKQVVITLHATLDPPHDPEKRLEILVPALARCSRILVHSIHDMNRLKAYNLIDNVCLFPHGVVAAQNAIGSSNPIPAGKPITIASYGFFLPNKGLPELIEAIHLLRQRQLDYRLLLVNAEFPAEISRQLIEKAKGLIKAYGLGPYVELETRFLSDEESLNKLARADSVIYAYQDTSESASGAVRYGLASGKPVITTPIPIFQDISELVFKTPGTTPADLANGIETTINALRQATPKAQKTVENALHWRESHGYPLLGQRLAGMLRGIFRDHVNRSKAG